MQGRRLESLSEAMFENLLKKVRSLGAMVALLDSIVSNKLIVACLGSQLLDKKLTTQQTHHSLLQTSTNQKCVQQINM
jgi:hypothetical protein